MGILADSKRLFLEAVGRAEARTAKRLADCEATGQHDTSGGELTHRYGNIQGVQRCAVGIKVSGKCPNCGVYYERLPTSEERKTPEYRALQNQLSTRRSIDEMLLRPMTI